jgi:hypothetical protein
MEMVGQQVFTSRFYLAGGTALALQLGHRRSIDLDFFSEKDGVEAKTRQEIIRALNCRDSQVLESEDGNLLCLLDGVHTGFFSYGYALVGESVTLLGLSLASLPDIGLMKCDALVSRGSRKDFYDLYALGQMLDMGDLLELGKQKYPHFRDFPLMVIEGMVLFDNADRDEPPDLMVDLPWPQVRDYFIKKSRQLGRAWFNL